MQSTEIIQLISDLERIRNQDNASIINNAISSIRSLKEDNRIMTQAYIDCATRLQKSALEKGQLEEKMRSLKSGEADMSPLNFRRNSHGYILREDWGLIVSSCKVIGDAIWDAPSSGMTEDGKDYLPADITREPEEIEEALKVVNAYFGRKSYDTP